MTSTERKWARRVEQWRKSGKSARQFAEGRGFSAGGLRHWAHRLGTLGLAAQAQPKAARDARPRLLRVARVQPTVGALVAEGGGVRLSIPSGADPALLRATLAALVEAVRRTWP